MSFILIIIEEKFFNIDSIFFNLSVVALTQKNCNVCMVVTYLHKLVQVYSTVYLTLKFMLKLITEIFLKVFCEYFAEFEEESIRDNFVIIYELLDEMMDFGYPQTTESKILQE